MAIKTAAYVFLLICGLVLIGCGPTHNPSPVKEGGDKMIGGNLAEVEFVAHANACYIHVVLTFEEGEIYRLLMFDNGEINKFHLNRINNVWHTDCGYITKVEILE